MEARYIVSLQDAFGNLQPFVIVIKQVLYASKELKVMEWISRSSNGGEECLMTCIASVRCRYLNGEFIAIMMEKVAPLDQLYPERDVLPYIYRGSLFLIFDLYMCLSVLFMLFAYLKYVYNSYGSNQRIHLFFDSLFLMSYLPIDLMTGVKALHKSGIIHHDIKPQNSGFNYANGRFVHFDYGLVCT
ncbi:MAG: hypothetical protein ACRD5B_19455, partial [Nitrososphaeraceae archaeon]